MELSPRQRRVLDYIWNQLQQDRVSPSYRELGQYLDLTAKSAREVVLKLAQLGFLDVSSEHRSIRLTERARQLFGIPVLGYVPAGKPEIPYNELLDTLQPEDVYPADADFALRVTGDSMVEAGIFQGDTLALKTVEPKPGDIVVAIVDNGTGEMATVKRLAKENMLEPASPNPAHKSISLSDGRIIGRVIRVIRHL